MPATAITETVSLMEIFFAAFCNAEGGTQIPDCRGCEHNEYKCGCTHAENPANKMLRAVEIRAGEYA